MDDIMKNRYVLQHQALIQLADIDLLLVRIQNEGGDLHANALATDARDLITAIRKQTVKIWPPADTITMLQQIRDEGEKANIEEDLFRGVVEEYRLHSQADNPSFVPEDVWFPDYAIIPSGRHFLKSMSDGGIYDNSFSEFLALVMTHMGWTADIEMRNIRFMFPSS